MGSFPSWNRWAEWNGKYRDDIRKFLKGDENMAAAAIQRILVPRISIRRTGARMLP